MHGGMLFASNLALSVGIDLEFDYLHATRYRGALTGSGLAWLHRPRPRWRPARADRRRHPRRRAHAEGGARLVRGPGRVGSEIAVLCVKNHDRRVEGIDADYIALEVPDSYVYGYGMDYHEQGRNLPGIYALVR
jgi:hypoxanthine phosphoribosyltransferase